MKRSVAGFLLMSLLFIYTVIVLQLQWYLSQQKSNTSELLEVGAHIFSTETSLNKSKQINRKNCKFKEHQYYPLCKEKYAYLKNMWKNNIKCFRDTHGIDGSHCSLHHYLTKVEPFCADEETDNIVDKNDIVFATPRTDLEGMLKLLPGKPFRWMRERVTAMWDDWVYAIESFQKRNLKYKKKKVAALMGSMGFQPMMMELAGRGGPLGELIQWTDLIAGLYVLGYDVHVFLNASSMGYVQDKDGCAALPSAREYDVIYTDLNGCVLTYKTSGYASSAKYRCSFRILDSFGTMPEYNYPGYPHDVPGGRSPWGNMNFNPMQFYTLYPHTQDNTFLGFVVGSNRLNEEPRERVEKEDKALLYAKRGSYISFPKLQRYIKIVSEYFEIHATAVQDVPLPDYIKNHGSVSGSKVKELLLESKLFIGVGFPYEGPGPIEAMAAGTPMIQPKYKTPRNKLNEDFFKEKPTLRELTSQSPYMEEFVGEPYTYTIDVSDEKLLRETLQKIKDMNLPPKIPKEFTNEGMLERLHVFTEHVDYCDIGKPRWPPLDRLKVQVASLGQSCKDVCMSKGLVCERNFFDDLNSQNVLERLMGTSCTSVKNVIHINAPSFDPVSQICYLQSQAQVYSCSHRDKQVKQVCPCRQYMKEQSAICEGCI